MPTYLDLVYGGNYVGRNWTGDVPWIEEIWEMDGELYLVDPVNDFIFQTDGRAILTY